VDAAVGLNACAVGYRVSYTTSAQLSIRLTGVRADKRLTDVPRGARAETCASDEFAFYRIERKGCPQAADLLYKVIASRHQKRLTIVIINVDFDAAQYLGDAALAIVRLDRARRPAVFIKLKGPPIERTDSEEPPSIDRLPSHPATDQSENRPRQAGLCTICH